MKMNNELLTITENELKATPDGIKMIRKMQKAKIELARMEEEIKSAFVTVFEQTGQSKFVTPDGSFKATYYPESKSKRLNSKKLKEELPDVYEEYLTESVRKAYVKFN